MKDSTEWMSLNEMLKSVKTAVFDEHKPAVTSIHTDNAKILQDAYVLTKDMLIKNIQPMGLGEKEFAVASARILKKFARMFAMQGLCKQNTKRVMAKEGS